MSPGRRGCRRREAISGMRSQPSRRRQASLLAHCASFAVNALYEPANRYNQGRVSAHGVRTRLDQANVLARAVGLDMVAGRLETNGRQLSRPRHKTPHPRGGSRSKRRAVGATDRPSEEGRYGQGGRAASRRFRLVAGAAASRRGTSAQEQDGEAGPLPEFLADDEDRDSASDDDRPQLDAAE